MTLMHYLKRTVFFHVISCRSRTWVEAYQKDLIFHGVLLTLYPFVDGSEKYTRGSVKGDARVQVPPITVLSAVQRVSKCENPAGWGQSSAAYSQKCTPAADRAHGGERDDGTEMIADSYIWVRFFSDHLNIILSDCRVMSCLFRKSYAPRSSS